MEKKFNFGKIAYGDYAGGKKACLLEAEAILTEEGVFAAEAAVWNPKHTDCVVAGQCLDDPNILKAMEGNVTYKTLIKFWKLYHLNDLHAGTKEQEDLLKERPDITDFDERLSYLASKNMEVAKYKGSDYRYGSGWIKEEIPAEDLVGIKKLLIS